MNKKKNIVFIFFAAGFLLWSCDLFYYGKLGGADQTDTYYPTEALFEERMIFLSGVWYSHYADIGRLDGYRIRRWGDLSASDKAKAQTLFPFLSINNPSTYSSKNVPQGIDYIVLYDDTVYKQSEDNSNVSKSRNTNYMGLVRAINIFNGDKNRGAIIIEYFEEADPRWLSNTQGLKHGEKPFFGIYFRVLDRHTVQMANPVDLAAMYAGKPYYTEKGTLQEAINANTVENEAEFISWGVVIPQERE